MLAAAGLLLVPALARADVVHEWNTIMLSTISGQNPFAQARFAAITQRRHAAYGVTTIFPFSPCIRQWNPNVPVAVIATGASWALSGGMSPDSYVPLSNVAECTIESLFLKFTYCPALTVSGLGEYVLLVMKTVIGFPLLPSPLPLGGVVGLAGVESHPPAANAALITNRMATA